MDTSVTAAAQTEMLTPPERGFVPMMGAFSPRFASDMAQAGFALRVDDPDFVRRTRVLPFVHGPSGMPVDVVLAGSGLEDEFIERAVPTEIDGTSVPVNHLDDLIVARCWPDGRRISRTPTRCGACMARASTAHGFATR